MVENSRYRLSLYLEVVVIGRGPTIEITDGSLKEKEGGSERQPKFKLRVCGYFRHCRRAVGTDD